MGEESCRREKRMLGLELRGEIIYNKEQPPPLEAQCEGYC